VRELWDEGYRPPRVIPFVDTVAKADECVARIDSARAAGEARPVVFTTLVDDKVREVVRRADAPDLDESQA